MKLYIWYITKFPAKAYRAFGALLIGVGLIETIAGISPVVPTVIVCAMIVAVAPVHVVAWKTLTGN